MSHMKFQNCHYAILGTLCYCDAFCNRTHNSDCCPDYFTHCEGLPEIDFDKNEIAPETLIRPEDSKFFNFFSTQSKKNFPYKKKNVVLGSINKGYSIFGGLFERG